MFYLGKATFSLGFFEGAGQLPVPPGPGHDLVRFVRGPGLFSTFCVWRPNSIELTPAAYRPSTQSGKSSE